MKLKFIEFFVLILLLVTLPGCKNWHSLQLETQNQPVQFGAFSVSSTLDTLGTVSAYTKYDIQEETSSASQNLYIEIGGGEYFEENLNEVIYRALEDDNDHFIANGQVVAEVKHGISLGAIIAGLFADLLAGPNSETEIGTYSEEHIFYNGMVYKIKPTEPNNE